LNWTIRALNTIKCGSSRGTYDADSYIEFDNENNTKLSNFINVNNSIRIRLNITNTVNPFDLSIDNFGVVPFYWGLYNNEFDTDYLWNYGTGFDPSNLLNLEVQVFEIINGTGDEFLDILVGIGREGMHDSNPMNAWPLRICLFDVKNEQVHTKWTLNKSNLPFKNVRVIPLNNSLNHWLISGIYQFGSEYNCSHKIINDPYWESHISRFESYSDSKVLIEYDWQHIPSFPGMGYIEQIPPYEFPGKAVLSENGKIGILIGDYGEDYPPRINIQIVDIQTKDVICNIPTEDLCPITYSIPYNPGEMDFSTIGAGYRLLLACEDFNQDGYKDHVGIYNLMHEEYHYRIGSEVRIINGNSGTGPPEILFKKSYENTYIDYEDEFPDQLKMPFSSIDDVNNDGFVDAIIGIEANVYSYGYSECKGSKLDYFDIYNSNEYQPVGLGQWIMEPFDCIYAFYYPDYQFFSSITSIGDLNGDSNEELFVERYNFEKITSEYGYETYIGTPSYELIDLLNRMILFQFNIEIKSVFPIEDLNGDGKNEFLVLSNEEIFCVNSKFGANIINPGNNQQMNSHSFEVEWNTNANYDYFEVFVNAVSQGQTTGNSVRVSLSSGWKSITVVMHDESGIVNALSTIKVLVPPNNIQLILTFVIIGLAVGLFIFYRIMKKRRKTLNLIQNSVEEEGMKDDKK